MTSGGERFSEERLAPVIPLFGRGTAAAEPPPEPGPGPRHPASVALAPRHREGRLGLRGDAGERSDGTAADPLNDARKLLTRRLASKQLSSREAHDVLREQGLPAEDRELLVAEFEERRYLDDTALAEYLVTSGSERKGQGRVSISRTLVQRGIPREIADEALSVLEDDDSERALDYARAKVSGLRRYDEDTAIRRLVGQLSRRGYGGAVALNAARTAWREGAFGGARGRVRFEDAD